MAEGMWSPGILPHPVTSHFGSSRARQHQAVKMTQDTEG